MGEILDGAFSLYRRHFRRFFGAELLPQLLPIAVWTAFLCVASGPADPETAGTVLSLTTMLERIATVPATAACIWLASAAVLGDDLSTRAAYRVALRRFWPLVGAGLLANLAIGLGLLLLVVPGLIAAAALFAHRQAIVLEGRGAVEALSRSATLARGAWDRSLGVQVVLMLAWFVPALAFGAAVAFVPGFEIDANGDWFSAHAYAVEGIVES